MPGRTRAPPKASARAKQARAVRTQRGDHAELRGGRAAHRRPEGLEWRAHEAKRSAQPRNTAQASAQGGAKMQDDRGGRATHRRPEGLEWRAHEAKRSAQPRNTAQASAQGGAKMQDDHCELWNRRHLALKSSPAACTAGTGRFLRRKISFSRAKIVSLQFPRPKIRRILAETD